MKIGFTGTRKGMSLQQKEQLRDFFGILRRDPTTEFHHGAAVGADEQAAAEAELHFKLVEHPAGADPLKRNREIVAEVDILIAAPETDEEQLRSGTWATVRYARQKGIPVVMLSRGDAK